MYDKSAHPTLLRVIRTRRYSHLVMRALLLTIVKGVECINAALADELNVPHAMAERRTTVAILVDEWVRIELIHRFWCVKHEALALKFADGNPELLFENCNGHVTCHLALNECKFVEVNVCLSNHTVSSGCLLKEG